MPIELPKTKIPPSTKSPEVLIIFSAPKVGKTTLVAELENNLILDLEKGSNFVSALKIKVSSAKEYNDVCEEIKKEGKPYKYITIDTVTALEDFCLPIALNMYKKTPMGSTFTGTDILSLPNGAGYKYVRDAFELMINKTKEASDRVILLGHTKEKLVGKEGKEVNAKELSLTGKLSSITCANADAIGCLYREGNKCIITFETENELVCGARPEHLRNKKIVLSELIDGKLVTYWNKIFID